MTKNFSVALIDILTKINLDGSTVITRGNEQKEILSHLMKIDNSQDRVITLPSRNNNIFALISETLWVLGGKDEMDYLSHYLPRATDFSDNGKTWRAAYGPRLRNWYGVDQFKEIARLILEDQNTKRAVMVIYDPLKDYVDTKDVPCNNWIHFIARNGKLHMNVTIRANDAIWGFGGINSFEWSVLHEMMAYWTNLEIGTLSWYTGTIHIYERHYNVSQKILDNFCGKTLYDFQITSPKFTTALSDFDNLLQYCFAIEKEMRDPATILDCYEKISVINDDFLKNSMLMLFAYNLFLQEASEEKIKSVIENLDTNDFKIAAIEYFSRRFKNRDLFSLKSSEKEFFDYFWKGINVNTNDKKKLSFISSI